MEIKGSNQSLVKTTNQALIIKTIREKGKMSRSEIAKHLSLSNPSVSKNVDDLIEKGLLIETGSLVTDVGRRPIMLEFNGHHGCVAVVDLSSSDGRICIADLDGNKLKYSRVEGGKIISRDMLDGIIVTLKSMLKDIGENNYPLVGICIGVPGVVEPESGRLHWSSRIENYEELDLKYMFNNEFNVPITIKNDVNLAVCGERVFGCGNNAQNMIYINIDAGVGIGIVLDGNLYEGRRGFAGDLGVILANMDVTVNTDRSEYMKLILENKISTYNMVSDAAAMFDAGRETVLRSIVSNSSEIVFTDLIKAYGMGDPAVRGILYNYAKYIAVLMKNLVSLLDVDLIVIGGQTTRLGSSFINDLTDYFLSLPGYATAQIRASRLLDTAVIYGGMHTASQIAINEIIEGSSK